MCIRDRYNTCVIHNYRVIVLCQLSINSVHSDPLDFLVVLTSKNKSDPPTSITIENRMFWCINCCLGAPKTRPISTPHEKSPPVHHPHIGDNFGFSSVVSKATFSKWSVYKFATTCKREVPISASSDCLGDFG